MQTQILTPWTCRRWRFDFPSELYPAIIERLRGLPARAEELASSVDADVMTREPATGWSIQQHLGHLADLEALLAMRLDAYEAGLAVLPQADMSNAGTLAADHNARDRRDVLSDLRSRRMATVTRLEGYPRDFFGRSAWHERLGMQKRVVDCCAFFADHDDHHLALAMMVARDEGPA